MIRFGRVVASLLFFVCLYGSGLLISLYALAFARASPARLMAVGAGWARFNLAVLAVLCGVRVKREGWESLPASGVLAGQHQSELDILVLLAYLPAPTFVLKQELLKMPLFGACLRPAGMIPIDRDGAAPALRGMVKAARGALAAGRTIVIFPQGTRVAPGVRAALQPGVAALAAITGAGVIPMTVDSGRCWGGKGLVIMPGVVTMRVLPALASGLGRVALLEALAAAYYGPSPFPLVGEGRGGAANAPVVSI